MLTYEYDSNKLISKINYIENGVLEKFFKLIYENQIPQSTDGGAVGFTFDGTVLKKYELYFDENGLVPFLMMWHREFIGHHANIILP